MIRLNQTRLNRYIDLFDEQDYIDGLKKTLLKKGVKVYLDYNYKKDYCWTLFSSNGYEDEITEKTFRYIINGGKYEKTI